MGGDEELTFRQKVSNQWNGFKEFMWDGENKRFMGRSGKSWGKLSRNFCMHVKIMYVRAGGV